MALILDALVQLAQLLLVLLLAPLLTGYVRKVKAHLLRRRGPPVVQPYRDLLKLIRKEVVLADNASWVFRVAPYLIFATTLVAAALVPTFATGLVFSPAADLIAIVALLGSARFVLALAGLDIGTSFGGIGSSREMMIASLAEPAMLMIVFTLSLLAGSTQLSSVAAFMQGPDVGLRVSLAMSLVALIMVAIAENARIPVDNPATHLELTMIHEAMILEYSGRHLAVIEVAASLKLLLYLSLIACVFVPWGVATAGQGFAAYAIGLGLLCRQAGRGRLPAGGLRDRDGQDARLPRFGFPRRGPHARPAGRAAPVRFAERVMDHLALDVAHLFAGGLVLVSFMLLYQDRMFGLLNTFALHALVVSLSVAWQAYIQHAPHLYITAAIALVRQGHHHSGGRCTASSCAWASIGPSRPSVGIGQTMLAGIGLVALSILVMLPITAEAGTLAREDLAFSLSVILLGLLMMISRRNAVSQVIGFMSIENGLILAATAAKGMPLVVEISVAFSILVALIVIGIFLFRIRERFDTVDVHALERFRGEQP